jgi:hypothetical protein
MFCNEDDYKRGYTKMQAFFLVITHKVTWKLKVLTVQPLFPYSDHRSD